jgi:hypothetical protein
VFCDPLQRSQLEQAVDFGQVQAAMVLCDEWCVQGGDRTCQTGLERSLQHCVGSVSADCTSITARCLISTTVNGDCLCLPL